MIDRIKFSIPGNYQFPNMVCKHRTKNFYTGYLEPIKLSQYFKYLKVEVSLPKLLNKQNISPLNLKTVKESILQLQDDLRINLDKSIVTYIEVGTTVITEHDPGNYTKLFGQIPRLKRNRIDEIGSPETTRYFSPTGGYQFTGYNKLIEVMSKKNPMFIPVEYRDCNLLRLEYRIVNQGSINRKFGSDFCVHDLYIPGVYRWLKSLFFEFYNRIPKTEKEVYLNCDRKLTSGTINDFEAEILRQLHPDIHESLISSARTNGFLDNQNFSRIKKMVKTDKPFYRTEPNILIAELDSLIADCMNSD